MSDPNDRPAYPSGPPEGAANSPIAPMAPMAPMPDAGPRYGEPVAPIGPAPKAVANAAMLMLVGAGVGLIGIILSYADKSALRKAIIKKNPTFDTAKVNTAVNAGLASATVVGVIVLLLYVWLSRQLLKGKNWARIVTWIIAALGLLAALTAVGTTVPALTRVFDLIAGVIDIAIIALLLQKPSNAFFRRRR